LSPVQRLISSARLATMASAAAAPLPLAIRPQEVEESATVYAVFAIE
jgi:hypothetical protein